MNPGELFAVAAAKAMIPIFGAVAMIGFTGLWMVYRDQNREREGQQ